MSTIAANGVAITRLLFYSSVGTIAFFIPLAINDRSTILMNHIVTYVSTDFALVSNLYCVATIVAGAVLPFVRRTWAHSKTVAALSIITNHGNSAGCHVSAGQRPASSHAAEYVALPV